MERLKQIQAFNMFGHLDQDVELATEHGVTLLHGANGSGKTTLLKCLSEVSDGNWQSLYNKPLERLILTFDSGNRFEMRKTTDGASCTFSYIKKNQEALTWTVSKQAIDKSTSVREWMELKARLDITSRKYGNKLSRALETLTQELGDRRSTSQTSPSTTAPDWLHRFQQYFLCTLIEEQRLIKLENEGKPKITIVVSDYSRLIINEIKEVNRKFNEMTQSLERTFPKRLVKELTKTPPNLKGMLEKYATLERKRSGLHNAGLIDVNTDDISIEASSLDRLDVRTTLSLLADDASSKLALFDPLFVKIALFEKLIRGYFSRKWVTLNSSGISIVTEAGEKLDVTALSSGEQHVFVLFFRLIFVEPTEQHLVMIDEPELSLHPAWQLRFIDDLETIRDISQTDFLLASHSPLLFQGHRELARDLNI